MTLAADTSFMVSLYGVDVNTPAARAWMACTARPIVVSSALRFESENALRLACFRQTITPGELMQAMADIASDFSTGILLSREIPSSRHWAECQRISQAHTLTRGTRAFDILHVAGARLLKASTFLTFDQRQGELARSVGLIVAP